MEHQSYNNFRPSVCFEVQKVIGMTIGTGNVKNYQVQWAPTWVSDLHLVGCEHLISEFLQQQTHQQVVINSTNDSSVIDNSVAGHGELLVEEEKLNVKKEYIQVKDAQNQHSSNEQDNAFTIAKDLSWCENEYTAPGSISDNLSDSNVNVVILETKGIEGAHFNSEDNTNLNFEWMTKSVEQPCFSGECYDTSDKTPREKSNVIFDPNKNCTHSDFSSMPLQSSNSVEVEGSNVINKNSVNKIECNNILKHKCITCRKIFDTRDLLIIHRNKYHCVEERLKQFTKQKTESKLNTTPTKDKPYQCGVCQQVFSLETRLLSHTCIRCPVCNKLFTHRNDYRKHSRTHSGEKPFKCSICDKPFRNKSSLKKHFEVHESKIVTNEEINTRM